MIPTRQHTLRTQLKPYARITGRGPGRWGVALVEAVLGYLWLVSALNKLLNAQFRPGLAHVLHGQLKGNPNQWWVGLVSTLVLPHAAFWAAVVEVGELLVALGYGLGVVLWLSGRFPRTRWSRHVNGLVLLALLSSALLSVNYYLLSGDTVPGLAPSKPFQEGLSIDGLAALLAIVLVVVHLLALRASPVAPGGRLRRARS